MDIDAYRKQCLAELKSEQDSLKAAQKTAAKSSIRYEPGTAQTADELIAMIRQLPLDGEAGSETIQILLAMLADEALAPAVRLRALRHLGGAEFHPIQFEPFRPQFIKLLRNLATSSVREVRLAALERLTLSNDRVAQKLLREGLEKTRKPLVPAAKAVQLLGQDSHAAAFPILRDLAMNAKGKVREAAVRALASDPKSGQLLEQISTDKLQNTALRQLATLSLKNASATRFGKIARQLVLDEDDDDKLRAAAMSAIAHTSAVATKVAKPRFNLAVDTIKTNTKSRALRASIGRYKKLLGKQAS
jgi:hypothetical protein